MPVISGPNGSRWVPDSHGRGVNVQGGGKRSEADIERAYLSTVEGLARLYSLYLQGTDAEGLGVTQEDIDRGINEASQRFGETEDSMRKAVISYYEFTQSQSDSEE